MTEVQDKAALGLQVAERLWVPCLKMQTPSHKGIWNGQGWTPIPFHCSDCNGIDGRGTSKVYPLREPCLECPDCNPSTTLKKNAIRCQNRRWLPNTDYDALLAAVRAKRWELNISTHQPEGDIVIINNTTGLLVGCTEADDGLRGMEAIQTAVLRALDKVGE